MKVSYKFLPILGLTLLIVSCSSSNISVTKDIPSNKTVVVTPEMKDLSNKMIQASKDLATTQVIGNTTFKSYDRLIIKYGISAKNLSQSKEFRGKEWFVVLTSLKQDTEYAYEIYSGTNKISTGTIKTQKK